MRGTRVGVTPGMTPLGRGDRVPGRRLLPLRLGGQPATDVPGVGVGLEVAHVLHRLVVRQRLESAEPSTQPAAGIPDPESRTALSGAAAPLPARRAPQAFVVVAAGLDEHAVGGVRHRCGVQVVRGQVDPVGGSLVVQRPQVGRGAHHEGPRRHQHLRRPVAGTLRRAGSGVRQGAGTATQLVGGQHRLVVLVLVLEHHPIDETRGQQRVRVVQPHAVEGVEHLATDQVEVVQRLGRAQQREAGPGGAGVLEGVVQRIDLGTQRRCSGGGPEQPQLLVVAHVGEIPDQRRHQPRVLSGQLGLIEHLGRETEGSAAAPLELTSEEVFDVLGFRGAHRGPSVVARVIMSAQLRRGSGAQGSRAGARGRHRRGSDRGRRSAPGSR